jgi:hypothetical protein
MGPDDHLQPVHLVMGLDDHVQLVHIVMGLDGAPTATLRDQSKAGTMSKTLLRCFKHHGTPLNGLQIGIMCPT